MIFKNKTDRISPEWKAALDLVTSRSEFILGPSVERFEAAFAQYLGVEHCVGVSNGTTALQLALHACDIGPGDEVVTTPHTWISTSWAISYVGAKPVYVDIDPVTYTLDPALVQRAITPRTKAILPVHLYGQACDLGGLGHLADKNGLLLIEDAAQAHGAAVSRSPRRFFRSRWLFQLLSGQKPRRLWRSRGHRNRRPNYRGPYKTSTRSRSRWPAPSRRAWLQRKNGRHSSAVLDVKLRHLDEWNNARRRHANRMSELLEGIPGLRIPDRA